MIIFIIIITGLWLARSSMLSMNDVFDLVANVANSMKMQEPGTRPAAGRHRHSGVCGNSAGS